MEFSEKDMQEMFGAGEYWERKRKNMWQIIVVKNLAANQRRKLREQIITLEKALRKRNQRIMYISKKNYALQERVAELAAKLQIRGGACPPPRATAEWRKRGRNSAANVKGKGLWKR